MLLLRLRPPAAFAALALALPAMALEWKVQTITVTTTPFQSTQDVAFAFANRGTKPVTIVNLETNCDCLDASADQKVYAPGAAGVIKAQFTVGDRYGLYERIITVSTDDGAAPVRLLVKIEVPEIVTLTPRSIAWKLNGPAEEKSIDLQPVPGLEIVFSEARPTNNAFTARLETVEAGRHYRLHLLPRGTAQPVSAAIRIMGRAKSGQTVVISAYGNVQ